MRWNWSPGRAGHPQKQIPPVRGLRAGGRACGYLEAQRQALGRNQGVGALRLRLAADPVEQRVDVLRIVVKNGEKLGTGGVRQMHALLPGRVSPAAMRRGFSRGMIAVKDDHIELSR